MSGLLVALLCGGHVLMEGVPGVAKTLLVRTLGGALDVRDPAGAVHARPDARRHHRLDGDRQHRRASSASARARSSPTCCWPTRSTGRRRRPSRRCWRRWRRARSRSTASRAQLPRPFLVAATQNPVEYEGTYPLPEAQLDRFLLKVVLPIPPRADELEILRRHAHGLRPARRRRRRRAAGGRRRPTSPPARPPCRAVQVSPEVAGYIVDIARATRESPSLSLGVSPRGATALLRAARAWAWLDGPRLRDARRRQGARPRDARAPARAAPRGRARGRRRRAGARLRARLGAGPPLRLDRWRSPAASRCCSSWVSWRWCCARPWARCGCGCWSSLVAGRRSTCCSRPRPEPLTLERRAAGAGADRPAEPRRRWSPRTASRAPCAACVRDAWQPTAGATGNRHRVRARARRPDAARRPPLLPAPPRRPARRRRDRAAARAARARGAAAHPRRARRRSGRCRPSSRASTCRPGWPGCASSTGGPRCGSAARAPSSTRCASTSAATTSARSTGGPAPATATSWSAPGSPSATAGWCWCSTRRARRPAGSSDVPRLDSAMDAALLLAALAARAGDRVDFVAGDRRVRSPAALGRRPRRRRAGSQDAMADLEPVIAEADWGALAGAVSALGRQRALVVLLTPLEPSAVEEGLLPVLPALTRAPPGRARVGARPRARAARRDPRHPRRGVRRRRGRAGAPAAGDAPPSCCAPSASTSSTPTPSDLPPALADHYLALKAARRCSEPGPTSGLACRDPVLEQRRRRGRRCGRAGRPPRPSTKT